MGIERAAVGAGHSDKKNINAEDYRHEQRQPRERAESAAQQIAMARDKDTQENDGEDSQKGMSEGVGDVEKRGLAERRHVGAVRNQDETTNQQPFGGAG